MPGLPPACCVLSGQWQCSSSHPVQFSRSVMSDSLRPHRLQHARPPCPSPIPGVYPNSHPLSQWCHPNISSSVVPVPSCLQSFLASGSFQMGQLFMSGGQSIGVSASTSVLPIKGWGAIMYQVLDCGINWISYPRYSIGPSLIVV